MRLPRNWPRFGAAAPAIALAVAAAFYAGQIRGGRAVTPAPPADAPAASGTGDPGSVALTAEQARTVRVAKVREHAFARRHETEGFMDFNEDRTVQVFSPWTGRIGRIVAKTGDDVRRGDVLFTIDSPDLVAAESSLIAASGVLQLTTRALERARAMLESQSIAQKDLDQAESDQQTAQASLEAARAAVRIFGKTDAEIEHIVATRSTASELRICSPIDGRVTARNAAAGALVQPGSAPAPFTVADVSTLWMVANAAEDELPHLRVGQPVEASLTAWPGRTFHGRISNIGAAVDPNTHRIAVRSEIRDPLHELRPQMLGTFAITTGAAERSPAVPEAGVVREADGSTAVFVTEDWHHFVRRPVKIGLQQDGLDQVLQGVAAGDRVATDGALFVANELLLQRP